MFLIVDTVTTFVCEHSNVFETICNVCSCFYSTLFCDLVAHCGSWVRCSCTWQISLHLIKFEQMTFMTSMKYITQMTTIYLI